MKAIYRWRRAFIALLVAGALADAFIPWKAVPIVCLAAAGFCWLKGESVI